jgi:hypothetical protein
MGPYKLAEIAVFLAPRIYPSTFNLFWNSFLIFLKFFVFPDNPAEEIVFLEAARKKLKNTVQDIPADCVLSTEIGFSQLRAGNFSAVKVRSYKFVMVDCSF